MYVTKESFERATKRIKTSANPNGNRCTCGAELEIVATRRSIWIRPFLGGPGETEEVGEIFCPKCDGQRVAPAYGTPIYEDQITDIGPVKAL